VLPYETEQRGHAEMDRLRRGRLFPDAPYGKLARVKLPLASALLATAVCLTLTSAAAEERTLVCGATQVSFAKVPAGTFQQGAPANEPGREADEAPREVTLTHATFLSTTPITVGAFKAFTAATGYTTLAEQGRGGLGWDGKALVERATFTWKNPGFAQTDEHPVVLVTYADALAFARWLVCNGSVPLRLPTEAELERAARGDATTFSPEWAAAHGAKQAPGTRPVKGSAPNPFGLFDLAGHVAQWTEDMHLARTSDEAIDPLAGDGGSAGRVLKGGSWNDAPKRARPAARDHAPESRASAAVGFRLAFVPEAPRDGGLVSFEAPLKLKAPEAPLEAPRDAPAGEPSSLGTELFVAVVCVGGAVFVWQATRKKKGP